MPQTKKRPGRLPAKQDLLRDDFANDVKLILRGLGGIGALTGNRAAAEVADELIRSVDRVLDIVHRHENPPVDLDAHRRLSRSDKLRRRGE